LTLSTNETRPGETLSITVNTKPNSYVGLLGVDQSVLLLKKGNDLEQSAVFDELGMYSEKTRFNHRWYNYDSYADFESSGAAIITNAKEEIRK
jgi:CD109 antigen